MEPSRLEGAGSFEITVVIPCLNEAENIVAVHEEVVAELGHLRGLEVLFVDDGSTDATLDHIRALAALDPRVSYVSFSRNFGLEAAFSAGFSHARHPWVLQLDADLQFPPSESHRLLARADEGYDAVFGVRVDRQDSRMRRMASALHDFLARRCLGIELPAGASSFRLVRTDLARRVVELELGTPYFLATLPRMTRHWTTEPVAHRARRAGEPKVTVRGLARHAVELFFGHSTRLMSVSAALLMLGAVLAVLGAATGAFGVGSVAPALLGCALASGLVALAIMSRYVVQIGRGQPRVPNYLVREANIDVRNEHALLIGPDKATEPAQTAPQTDRQTEPAQTTRQTAQAMVRA